MATTAVCDSHDPMAHTMCAGHVWALRAGDPDRPCACECHLQDMRTEEPHEVKGARRHKTFPRGPFRNLSAAIAAVRGWRAGVPDLEAEAVLSAATIQRVLR